MLSIIKLLDVNGEPRAKIELPQLRIGDPVALKFKLERKTGGRHEVLEVDHKFRVVAFGLDASLAVTRQVLTLETAMGAPPTWKSIKAPPKVSRRIGKAKQPRTPI